MALLCLPAVAFASANITIVPGDGTHNNAGPPTFAPTGPGSQVGAGLISDQLEAGEDVWLDTSGDFDDEGWIEISASISSDGTGDLYLSADGEITQTSGEIELAGTLSVAANTLSNVTLDAPDNDFSRVAAHGFIAGLTLEDTNGLVFGGVITNASSEITAGGDIIQDGPLDGAQFWTFDVPNSAHITLTRPDNNFSGVGITGSSSAAFTDSNSIVFVETDVAGDLTVTAGGNILGIAAVVIPGLARFSAGGNVQFDSTQNNFFRVQIDDADDVILTEMGNVEFKSVDVAGDFTVTAGSAIVQSVGAAAAKVGEAVTLDANGGSILFEQADNEFAGPVSLESPLNVQLVNSLDLTLGAVDLGGNLSVAATGEIEQAAAATVDGTAQVQGKSVSLLNAGNDFADTVAVGSTDGEVAIQDMNDLTLGGSASETVDGPLTAIADDTLTIEEDIDADGELTLVADNYNMDPPGIGTSGITIAPGTALAGDGAIRLYGSTRSENSIAPDATFNGQTFTPGTIFANSARERWGVYYPDGTATPPFTFFYKDTDDTTPTATITSPADGATYTVGEVVEADYSCSDGGGGSGIVKCEGNVPDGSPIDTSSPGQKSFTVEAESGSGATSSTTVGYTVIAKPAPKITNLRVDPKKFAAGKKATSPTLLRAKKGAHIRFELSRDATVRFRIRRNPQQPGDGRPAKHDRTFTRELSAGEQAIKFTGTINGRTLKPRRWKVLAVATTDDGQRSARKGAPFRIVKQGKKKKKR